MRCVFCPVATVSGMDVDRLQFDTVDSTAEGFAERSGRMRHAIVVPIMGRSGRCSQSTLASRVMAILTFLFLHSQVCQAKWLNGARGTSPDSGQECCGRRGNASSEIMVPTNDYRAVPRPLPKPTRAELQTAQLGRILFVTGIGAAAILRGITLISDHVQRPEFGLYKTAGAIGDIGVGAGTAMAISASFRARRIQREFSAESTLCCGRQWPSWVLYGLGIAAREVGAAMVYTRNPDWIGENDLALHFFFLMGSDVALLIPILRSVRCGRVLKSDKCASVQFKYGAGNEFGLALRVGL